MKRILDLFCGGGGAAMGYSRAGFEIVGVDISQQPHYPFEFYQDDALAYLEDFLELGWDHGSRPIHAVHASPPCQFKTAYNRRPGHVYESPNLIPGIRKLLDKTGLPYVIENVEYARDHLINPVRLCGSSFGLDVRRHRLFECSFPVEVPPCDHSWQKPRFPPATNRTNLRSTVEIGVWRIPLETQQKAMGINWLPLESLSEAIPPAYTEHIGWQLMKVVQ